MKFTYVSMLIAFFLTHYAFSADIDMPTKVESVTIYHSGALVTRSSDIELKEGLNVLIFKNVSSKLILNSIKIKNKEITILNKTLIRKLTQEEHSQLLDKKDAIKKQISLIETKYGEAGFVTKVEDLEKMTLFYSEKILSLKKELRDVELKIEEAKELEQIDINNEDAAILKLIVSVGSKLKESFKFQYVCGGIGWSPAYEIMVENSGQSKIELKYIAKTMSQTGEDWDNVELTLSSSFPLESPTDLPKIKTPWVIDGRAKSQIDETTVNINEESKEQEQIARLEGVEYEEFNLPSFLKIRTLKDKYSIKSNSTVFSFPVQTVFLPASFYYYGIPSIDPEVYLVAQVTGWDTLGFVDGIAAITYGGNEIGKSVIKFSETKDSLLLPIGKDNSVYLKFTEIADEKYFKTTYSGKKQSSTYAYKYEIKNNNSFAINFDLVDQVPISQTKLVDVQIDKNSNGDIDKETGQIVWQLNLQPGQVMIKELVFTIETEGYYNYNGSISRKKETWRGGRYKF